MEHRITGDVTQYLSLEFLTMLYVIINDTTGSYNLFTTFDESRNPIRVVTLCAENSCTAKWDRFIVSIHS